jgi:membrane associated rhomboid family serine protease
MAANITMILIAVTVVASIYGWNNPSIQQKWMFNPFTVYNARQYYRFLSSGFIHSNSMHLLFKHDCLILFWQRH